jgi:ABC-type Fe3+-hydroxamate transport system, periplasmic component
MKTLHKARIFRAAFVAVCAALCLNCAALYLSCTQKQNKNQTVRERTITDILGRTVTIPARVERIAAINGAARMLTYARAVDKLVGVTDMDKKGAAGMPYSYVNKEKFQTLASVGKGGSNDIAYIEKIAELSPDLIFAFTNNIDAVNDVQNKTHIPTVALYKTSMFSDDFFETLLLIGSIMGTQTECKRTVDTIKNWQRDLNDRTKDIPDAAKPSVYAGAVSFRGGHGIEGTCGAYPPFTAVNAKNVVDSTGKTGEMLIDREKITEWDPDIIFLNPSNMNLVNEDYKKNKNFYENLSAVKNGRIYSQVSYNYNWTNVEIAIADAYYAGCIIYPERFADIDFNEKAEEIFKAMLGQTYLEVLDNAGIGFGPVIIGK